MRVARQKSIVPGVPGIAPRLPCAVTGSAARNKNRSVDCCTVSISDAACRALSAIRFCNARDYGECSNAQNWLFSAQHWCGLNFLRAHLQAWRSIRAVFFDGAAPLKRDKKTAGSRRLAMLRMLLAFTLRWIAPGLELNSSSAQYSRMANLKIKPSRGGVTHHGQ
jgi:hypothetical protein